MKLQFNFAISIIFVVVLILSDFVWGKQIIPKCKAGSVPVKRGAKYVCIERDSQKPSKKTPRKKITAKSKVKPKSGCPVEMVLVSRGKIHVCVDKLEYSKPGRAKNLVPLGYQNQANCAVLCGRDGKRLLTHGEWVEACRGTQPNFCNIYREHPLLRRLNGKNKWRYKGVNCKQKTRMWSVHCMNDPSINEMTLGLAENTEFPKCISNYGVVNMVGNLGEWVSGSWLNKRGERVARFNGGLYPQKKSSCGYTTVAHGPNYRDYSTGCRCGKDPQ